jgi:hypothetical protein
MRWIINISVLAQNYCHRLILVHALDNFTLRKVAANGKHKNDNDNVDPTWLLTVHCLNMQLQGFHSGEAILGAVYARQFGGWEW